MVRPSLPDEISQTKLKNYLDCLRHLPAQQRLFPIMFSISKFRRNQTLTQQSSTALHFSEHSFSMCLFLAFKQAPPHLLNREALGQRFPYPSDPRKWATLLRSRSDHGELLARNSPPPFQRDSRSRTRRHGDDEAAGRGGRGATHPPPLRPLPSFLFSVLVRTTRGCR